MRKLLRSKPVMIAGAAAVASKVIKNRGRQKKTSKLPKRLGAFALIGALGGAIRYFTNPVRGAERRSKLMGKKEEQPMSWQTVSAPTPFSSSSSETAGTSATEKSSTDKPAESSDDNAASKSPAS